MDKREKTYIDYGEVYKRLTVDEAIEAVNAYGELETHLAPYPIGTVFGRESYGEREPILNLYYLGVAHGILSMDENLIDIEMFMGYTDAETAESNREEGMVIVYEYETKLYSLMAQM